MSVSNREIGLHIEQAREMLEVATQNIANGFYASAINRAYYAIFHAANALLTTRGLSRSKHSGVIAVFREHFVKPGLIEVEYSDIYGRVMDNRYVSDYEIEIVIEVQAAEGDLSDSQRFDERIEQPLPMEGWL